VFTSEEEMTSSAFPSPVIGHGNHHHHNNGTAGNCCTNGGYSGSQTLPAGCNGNVQDWSSRSANSTHCQSSHNNNDEGDLDWWTISAKTMGLFALSLVFILIWTSVISGILVTHSYKEMEVSSNAAELFVIQKQIGQFAFLLGREMSKCSNCLIIFLLLFNISSCFRLKSRPNSTLYKKSSRSSE